MVSNCWYLVYFPCYFYMSAMCFQYLRQLLQCYLAWMFRHRWLVEEVAGKRSLDVPSADFATPRRMFNFSVKLSRRDSIEILTSSASPLMVQILDFLDVSVISWDRIAMSCLVTNLVSFCQFFSRGRGFSGRWLSSINCRSHDEVNHS